MFCRGRKSKWKLDCYWVGSLDFNFLGNQGVVHKTHKRIKLFAEGSLQKPGNLRKRLCVWHSPVKRDLSFLGILFFSVGGQASKGKYTRHPRSAAELFGLSGRKLLLGEGASRPAPRAAEKNMRRTGGTSLCVCVCLIVCVPVFFFFCGGGGHHLEFFLCHFESTAKSKTKNICRVPQEMKRGLLLFVFPLINQKGYPHKRHTHTATWNLLLTRYEHGVITLI